MRAAVYWTSATKEYKTEIEIKYRYNSCECFFINLFVWLLPELRKPMWHLADFAELFGSGIMGMASNMTLSSKSTRLWYLYAIDIWTIFQRHANILFFFFFQLPHGNPFILPV